MGSICWGPCGSGGLGLFDGVSDSIPCTRGSSISASLFIPVLGLGPPFLLLRGIHLRFRRRLLL